MKLIFKVVPQKIRFSFCILVRPRLFYIDKLCKDIRK